MPQKIIPLPDVYETIIRSVAVDAVRQIADVMQLPPETKVYLPGRAEAVPMNDGTFGVCSAGNSVYYDAEERVVVTYDELAEENFTLSTAVYNDENFPVFVNDTQGITIRPVRRFVDFRIDIEYQAPSVVVAQRWLDDQRIRYSAGGAELTMSLEYHYNVPDAIIGLLKGLYDTVQGSCWPTELSFKEWLELYWVQPTTDMVTLANTKPVLTVKERQVDVVGWFDFTSTPETPQRVSDNTGAYQATFSFICRYDRPTHLRVNYPLLMNQRPIPKVFRESPIYQNYQQNDRKMTVLRGNLESSVVMPQGRVYPYIQYPEIDDWYTDEIPSHRFTFFNGLLSLDSCDMTKLMDLSKLGDHRLNPYWLEFLLTMGTEAIAEGSLFEIRLYQNDQRLRIPLTIEPNTLNVRTAEPLNPEKQYHLQVSLVTNLYSIHERYWEYIRRYPTVFWMICRILNLTIARKDKTHIPLLGATADRQPCPEASGEGTTADTQGLDGVISKGIVKWSEVAIVRAEQDAKTENKFIEDDNTRMFNIFTLDLISQRR